MVEYFNYVISIRDYMIKPIIGYESFHPIMIKYYTENFKKIYDNVINHIETKNNKSVSSSIYSMGAILNYTDILKNLMDIYKIHNPEDKSFVKDSNIIPIETKLQKFKKAPNKSAKNFDYGFKMKSENDGNLYEVKGKTTKRWYICK